MAGDGAYYSLKDDLVVLPDRREFPSQDAYTHTALHELGHDTEHARRLNGATLVEQGGFGTETCGGEEARAEIAAMMTGEQLGVVHGAPARHGLRRLLDQGAGERPAGDPVGGRRNLGLAEVPRAGAEPGGREG